MVAQMYAFLMAKLPPERREAISEAETKAGIDALLYGQGAVHVSLDSDGLPQVVAIDMAAPGQDQAVMLRGRYENDGKMIVDELVNVDFGDLEARVLAHMTNNDVTFFHGNNPPSHARLNDMIIGKLDTFKIYKSPVMEVWDIPKPPIKGPKNKHGLPWYHGNKRRY